MIEPIVAIENLTKRFPLSAVPALNNISTNIYPGKMTGLVGPDGAGKSTLMRLMVGLLQFDTGSIKVAGYDIGSQLNDIHTITGYMPQKFGLYEDLTVIENLTLYAELRDIYGAEREKKFQRLLSFTNLHEYTRRLAGNLSGGMKQKLGLACALLGNPKVLLLDEPSVGVDPISRRELWKMVDELLDGGMAVVWSTAYLDEAEKCDSVILLNEGNKLHDGPAKDLINTLQGRVGKIRGLQTNMRRHNLTYILQQPQVMDVVIQGADIRVVLNAGATPPDLSPMQGGVNIHWEEVNPCFEDAFISVLGGEPKGHSPLAALFATRENLATPAVTASSLTKTFGDFYAVRNVNFSIKRGEIFGFLGPNGAGKSTTFKMLCGLIQPTAGTALVVGMDLKAAPSAVRNRIGYMAQKFSLYDNLSALQNLRFFSGVYGLTGKHRQSQIDLMIEIFELKNYLSHKASTLPLGFKQRLALACAVMHDPDVLFLDEPTSGVDPITRREFWSHINGMVEKGITVMVSTHFMDEAEYCDRIALIYRGESIATGSPEDLKQMVRSGTMANPTLEDAFIALIAEHDLKEAV